MPSAVPSLQAGFTSKTTQARFGLGSLVVTICKKFSGVALGFHLAPWSSSNPTIFKVLGCLDAASSITTGLQGLQHSALELVDAAPRVLPPQHLGAPLPGRVSAPRFSAPMGGTVLRLRPPRGPLMRPPRSPLRRGWCLPTVSGDLNVTSCMTPKVRFLDGVACVILVLAGCM